MDEIVIRDRGRGPELARIRITIFDLIPYLQAGYSPESITGVLPISLDEVHALTKYLDDHRDEVLAMNVRIEERIARGNPPEVVERLRALSTHPLIAARRAGRERENSQGSANGEGHS